MRSQRTEPQSANDGGDDNNVGTGSTSMPKPSSSQQSEISSPKAQTSPGTKLLRLLRLDAESARMRRARREYVARVSFSSHSKVSTVPLKFAANMDDSSENDVAPEVECSIAAAIGTSRRFSQISSEDEGEGRLLQEEVTAGMDASSNQHDAFHCQEGIPDNKSLSPIIAPKTITSLRRNSTSAISFNSSVEVINIPRAKDYSRSTREKLW